MYSNYFFTLTTMQKDSDRQFQALQYASRIDILKDAVRNSSMLWKKIMNAVSLSSTQPVALECVCFRFLLAKASDSAGGQNP